MPLFSHFSVITYCDRKDAKKACETFDGMEVRPRKKIVVKLSVQFTRLHVTGIPKVSQMFGLTTVCSLLSLCILEFIDNLQKVLKMQQNSIRKGLNLKIEVIAFQMNRANLGFFLSGIDISLRFVNIRTLIFQRFY